MTLDNISDTVLKFAQSSTAVISPASIADPIVPAPAAMTPESFNNFYFSLLNALTAAGVSASVPLEGVRATTVWFHVSTLVFHFQN